MRTSLRLPIAIVAAGLIIAGAVYVYVAAREPSTSSGQGNPALVRPVSTSDHVLGNPAAPVKIIEYSDFDCAYCQGFQNTLKQVIADMGANGKVAWVYRQFPLYELHPNAERHAEASECAAQAAGNEGFWRFAELLFKNQPVDPGNYGAIAAQAQVPSSAFAECMGSTPESIKDRISSDRENALVSGARGTPYSLIIVDGQPPIVMDGAYSYSAVKTLVEQALRSTNGSSNIIKH